MAGDELTRRGWHLTSEGQDQCVENGNRSADAIVKKALNLDFRDIAEKWLPTDLSTGRIKVDYLEGPSVLQVLKLRNISAPKDNEESQAAPKLWKITLTDGHANVVAICLEPLQNLSLLTPPGTKLLLERTVDVESSYLLLTNKNARLLGGRVTSLVESWELKRKLAQQSRQGIQTEGGPPPFVPFGRKISSMETPRRDNFKSLAASKQAKEEEDSEFQQQRQATIAEALTAKTKTFGGGQKQYINDRDLARIVEMGFSPDQASNALRHSGGNVNDAIAGLLSGGLGRDGYGRGGGRTGAMGGRGGGGGFRERGGGDRGEPRGDDDHDDSRRGGRGGRGGRRGRGDREEEVESLSSRPSGPATLFDFLETKIPAKSENQQGSSHNQRPQSTSAGSGQKSSASQQPATTNNRSSYSASNDSYMSRGPPQFNSGPPPSKPQPSSSSSANYRGGGPSQRNGINPSRPTDLTHVSGQSSDAGHRPADHSGSGRDALGGGRDSGHRSSDYGGGGGRDSRGGGGGGGGGGQHSDDFGHSRRQQNLPPRLANKLGREGSILQGQGARPNSGRGHQDNSHDTRTRYSGSSGGVGLGVGVGVGDKDQSSGANQNPGPRGRVLLEHNSETGGYNDRHQAGGYPGKPAGKNAAARMQHSSPGQNKPRFDQQNRQQQQQQQQGHGRMDGPSRLMLQRGQTVLAKYWEDDQMYRAMVEAVAENGVTAVVTFLDYGNQEEVLCSDIQFLTPQQNWNNSYPPHAPHQGAPLMQGPGFFPPHNMAAPPPPFPCQEGFGSSPIPNMEFRRGGSGSANRRQDQQDRRRPTQNFYMPPSRKKDG